MVEVVEFSEALDWLGAARHKHLLLGNGFSIALKPDIFSYGSLYDNADFSDAPHLVKMFEALGTVDFEIVIRKLQDAAAILSVYDADAEGLISQLQADADLVKSALVNAVAKRHPDRPYDIEGHQYTACRHFLSHFAHLFTLNYDVLLYWALMQSEVDDLRLRPDDGFRHPEDDPDQPYVSWQQSHSATVSYLHGALHLFDDRTQIIKYTWSKTDVPIVEQIRSALGDNRFPLFVAEGDSDSKMDRIVHNAYLHKSLRSFESCMDNRFAALNIYGHSLAQNDSHVLEYISRGTAEQVAISLYGDPTSPDNTAIVARAEEMISSRRNFRPDRPLSIMYYDASSAHVWG